MPPETTEATDEKRGSFFSRHRHQKPVNEDEKHSTDDEVTKVNAESASTAVTPVGFTELFRCVLSVVVCDVFANVYLASLRGLN
jgi:hypothetical protein